MTISAVGTLVSGSGSGTTTLDVSPTTVGDLLVLSLRVYQSTTVTATGVSGGGVTTWSRAAGPYADTDPASGCNHEIWIGEVTAAGAATITISYSGTVTALDLSKACQQFTSSLGVSASWAVDGTQAGGITTLNSTSCPYPALTASVSGELYFGHCKYEQVGAVGATSGFTYTTDNNGNIVTYNPNVSGGSVQPTSTQNVAAGSEAIAVLISETGGLTFTDRFAPDAILAQTGLTGAVTAIQDDPDSPDGNWLVG